MNKEFLAQTAHDVKPGAFEVWLSGRPKWLQTAASRMIGSRKMPDEREIQDLAELCIAEASADKHAVFEVVHPGQLENAAQQPELKLRELSDIRGVNAIKDDARLPFGLGNLTIVYGPNGAGKTGFTRILKEACGSRAKDGIYGNVYAEAVHPSSAKIHITVGVEAKTLEWNSGGNTLQALRHIHVFDSKTASMYMAKDNEAAYEPSRMRFVSSLIRLSDAVAGTLSARKAVLVSKMPAVPVEFSQTNTANWLKRLTGTTQASAIAEHCFYSAELDAERVQTEGFLAQQDIGKRLEAIVRARSDFVAFGRWAGALKLGLSEAAVRGLVAARYIAVTTRRAAGEGAKAAFGNAPLEGVGQEAWMHLWAKARQFSEAHAYRGRDFPVIDGDARCVLCHQELGQEGRQRISHFEAYVRGGLEVDAGKAEEQVVALLARLPRIPTQEEWMVQTAILKMELSEADGMYASLDQLHRCAREETEVEKIPAVSWKPVDEALTAKIQALNIEEQGLRALQLDGKRKEMENRVVHLKAQQWFSQQKEAIAAEVERLRQISILDQALALAGTTALSRKNTELARDELDAGYKERFEAELDRLGGNRLSVKPMGKPQGKGKTTFSLALHGTKRQAAVDRILSEGELRIVALAAFIADITGATQSTPFIFDDPISSLDQDFEERVVARLVELAKQRQVIVFTHRLSLVTLIEDSVKKLKDIAASAKLPPPVDSNLVTLRRLGKQTGLVTQFSIRDGKPQKAVNRLRDELLPKLKVIHDAGEVEAYESQVKGICSDFRILVERAVEYVLLNEVLLRFRRSVQTQGRVTALAKICKEDCEFIDGLMTSYSAFEHSQADELPAEVPDFAVLETDVKALAEWMDEFSRRAVA
ncbi:AAA family ATPase [Acidovorax sp. LjRoot38]|uniref:AAA family ATPase n=1 Tax=Acidovorax sp. LjRoot38 TaxID=3342327 RepID=UPI003ECE883E